MWCRVRVRARVGIGVLKYYNNINPFTTGNPFLGTNLLGLSIGRGSGALKGLIVFWAIFAIFRLKILETHESHNNCSIFRLHPI